MITIISRPQGGKTLHMIYMAYQRKGYIVCRDKREAERVYKQALDLGLTINYPIIFDDLLDRHRLRGSRIKELYIDNADQLIQALCRFDVKAISMPEHGVVRLDPANSSTHQTVAALPDDDALAEALARLAYFDTEGTPAHCRQGIQSVMKYLQDLREASQA